MSQTGDEGVPTTDPSEPDPMVTGDTIVVFGTRLLGQVDAPQPPLLELGTEDIAAYGAGSIAELLEALAPQVSSGRGRGGGQPVILVNGLRISSFRELRSYPPEAIEKVEVFAEEVAQRYGYSPDQRVVNFILKDNFSSRELEAEFSQPWDGGYSSQELEGTYLVIDGPSRLNFNLQWNNASTLTEAERGVVQSNPPSLATDPDPAAYRSLVADSAGLEATANWTTRLGEAGNSLSVNGTFERSDTLRLQGLDTVLLTGPDPAGRGVLRSLNADDPLLVDNRSETYSLGTTLNFNLGEWELTGTGDGSHVTSRSIIERRLDLTGLQAAAAAGTLPLDADLGTFADAGYDQARTTSDSAAALLTARSHPIYLPAGDVSVTLDAGFDWDRIKSEDTRNPGLETELTRGDLTAGVNLGIPLTSRDADVLGAIGDVNLNLAAGIDHLSDFGTLYDWSAGITWGLTDRLSLTATYINRDSAPTLSQLGNPEIATPNVQAFDFVNNETALVTVVTGGNQLLPVQSQSDWKLGFVWELPILERSNLSVDYIRNHSEDVAASFPVLTPEVEAAYPDRVLRDAAGRLYQIDQRPVSFAEQDLERLQFGLNLSGQIGSSEEQGSAARGGPGGFGAGGVSGSGRRGGGGGQGAGGAGQSVRGTGDPARFAAMREVLCGEGGSDVALRLARGETVTTADGQAVTLPAMMLERLRANGDPDPQQVEQMRQRVCSNEASPGGPGAPGGAGQAGIAGGPAPAGAPGGGGGGRAGAGPGPGGAGPGTPGGSGGGRWFVNLQYTLDLQNEVLVAPGGPLLDLLDGAALTDAGQPRHSASVRLGVFYKGFGSFVSGTYTGSSRIDGTGLPGSTDLSFGDLATLDIRTFVDLGQQQSIVDAVPFFESTRVSFGIDNIFDARQRVTDSAGEEPLRYQPFLIDPVGRSFEIEFRKLF